MSIQSLRRAAAIAVASVLSAACADSISAPAEPGEGPPLASTILGPVEDLGMSSGGQLLNINASGAVVGYVPVDGGNAAIVWTPTGGRDTLQSLAYSSSPQTIAHAIADAGQIVGTSEASDGTPRAVLWSSSSAVPQDLQPGLTIPSRAYDINRYGMVVGKRERSTGDWSRAFAWTAADGARELPSLGTMASAYAVNDSGVAVGFSTGTTAGSPERAVRWTAAGQIELLPVPGPRSMAQDVNLRGEIVGSWHNAFGQQRAFYWSAQTGFIDIGTGGGIAAVALSINHNGMVVGLAVTSEGNRAWAWTPRSGMRQLEGLGGSRSAYAINRNGQVAGDAIDPDGNGHLVRWRLSEFNSGPTVELAPGVRSAAETDSITLTAIGQDPEGDPLRYEWTFGNGATFNDPPTTGGSTVRRRYGDNGSYPVQVVVVDPSGARDTATVGVTIHNVAPTGVFTVPAKVTEGAGYMLIVNDIVDGNADLRAGIQVAFDCGTGSFGAPSTAVRVVCPAWPDNDTLTVAVKLRDKDGDSTVYSRSLIVLNTAPVTTSSAASPTTIRPRESVTIQGSFTDAGTADGPWKYRFTWGDGTYTEGYVNAQGAVPTTRHLYRTAGTYRQFLRVTDKDGVYGTSAAIIVTVAP